MGPAPNAKATTLALLAAAVVVTASGFLAVVVRGLDGPQPPGSFKWSSPADTIPRTAVALESGATPLRVRIPSIRVDASLVSLGLDSDGTLQVPRYEEAGWYSGGSRPGEPGSSVIAAHLDSTTGPAVFHRLKELKPGHEVYVDYADVTVGFLVRDARRFAKSQFPTDEVYRSTTAPELRLVTCDGTFDRRAGTYTGNLVVWADIVSGNSSASSAR
jgi:LPXTG-site transpeptidase (sortase) family protein